MSGEAPWFKDPALKCDSASIVVLGHENSCTHYDYDEELVKALRPTFEVLMITMTWLSIIIDLASFKWRWIANSIIYFEGIFMIAATTVPTKAFAQVDSMYLNALFFKTFFVYYCDDGF